MISLFSKYAKVITLALALLIAAPVAISAAEESETGSMPISFGQNANRSFNGGGAPPRRRRVKKKVRRRRATKHRHNHAVLVHLTR